MLFKQLFDEATWTYTYLLADMESKEAVFIDPVNTHIDDYMALLDAQDLTLKYTLETHVHADHITASGLLRKKTGAQTAVGQACGAELADIQLEGGETLRFANNEQIQVISTPGHTPGSMSFLWQDHLFTGDSLFIDGCGRSDFQGGNPGDLYDSITQRLFTLPDQTLVYPGHDYNGRYVSSIQQERTRNPRLAGKTREEFVEIMNSLNLPAPRLIKESVPANKLCGLTDEEWQEAATPRTDQVTNENDSSATCAATVAMTGQQLVAEAKSDVHEIDVNSARQKLAADNVVVLDVREPDEFNAGALPNAINVPRGLLEFKIGSIKPLADKNTTVLLYCRTGGRSALATRTMQQLGYQNALSMAGGYDAWTKN
ncbi:MAG: MBL fold metallo-hydrolase [Gammaproteobacteria bacterium]|nr:MBL fold metallo-hydrolase [Gammaproteobacteria bacterium]